MSAVSDHINCLYQKKKEELHRSGVVAVATAIAYAMLSDLLNMPISEYFEVVNAKPTKAQLKGWIGECVTRQSLRPVKAKTRRKIRVVSNPLDDIREWLKHTGRGADFIIKIGNRIIALENKFAESLTIQNVREHVEPRFLTDREGKPLRKIHYKVLLLTNDETYISPSVRKYLKRKGILVMTTEEVKRFLTELTYSSYECYVYPIDSDLLVNSLDYSKFYGVVNSFGRLINSHLRFGFGILPRFLVQKGSTP